jgi:hypothetical protein
MKVADQAEDQRSATAALKVKGWPAAEPTWGIQYYVQVVRNQLNCYIDTKEQRNNN